MQYSINDTKSTPIASDHIDGLIAMAYPELTPEERAATRLDLEGLCDVLIEVSGRLQVGGQPGQLQQVHAGVRDRG